MLGSFLGNLRVSLIPRTRIMELRYDSTDPKQAAAVVNAMMSRSKVSEDATAVISKVPGSGGILNEWTVKEQLVYEIGDPNNYYMPDGIADFV